MKIVNILRPGAFGDVVLLSSVTSKLAELGYTVHFYTKAMELAALLEGVAESHDSDAWEWRERGTDYTARFRPMLNGGLHVLEEIRREVLQQTGIEGAGMMRMRKLPRDVAAGAMPYSRYITLQRTAGWSSLKEYPQWNEVLALLAAETGIPVVEIGPARPWRKTSALIQHAALHLGIDSVGAHIAAAHGTPAVVVFGSTSAAKLGHASATNLSPEPRPQCHPCWIEDRFPNGYRYGEPCVLGVGCSRLVEPERIAEAARKLLGRRVTAGAR